MRINGIDILNFNAKQFSVTLDHAKLDNNSEWVPGALNPIFRKSKPGMKHLSVVLSVHGDYGRDSIIQNCSKILELLVGRNSNGTTVGGTSYSEIELDGFSHKFVGVLVDVKRKERSMHKWHLLTLDFEGYETGKEIVKEFEVVNFLMTEFNLDATMKSPVKLRIKAYDDVDSLSISGLTGSGDNLVIENMVNGDIVEIDSFTYKINMRNGMNGYYGDEGPKITRIDTMPYVEKQHILGRKDVMLGFSKSSDNQSKTDVSLTIYPRYL